MVLESDTKKRRLAALKNRLEGRISTPPSLESTENEPSSRSKSTPISKSDSSPRSNYSKKVDSGPSPSSSNARPESASWIPLIKKQSNVKLQNHPIYDKLSTDIQNSLDLTYLGFSEFQESGSGHVVESMLRDLLQENMSSKRISDIIGSRLVGKNLVLENPANAASTSAKAKKRARKIKSGRSEKHWSLRDHRSNSSFIIPPHLQNYEYYEGLNVLWNDYIQKLTCNINESNLSSILLTADFHGAILKMIKSSDPNYVGLIGITVKETKQTFHIITKNNKLKVLPKKGGVFEFQILRSGHICQIKGDEFLELRN